MQPSDPTDIPTAAPLEGVARSRRRHIPNALTAARVVLAAVLVVLLSSISSDAWAEAGAPITMSAALAIFVLAAVTDALDGHLARKWGVVSAFGRVMDPFADKLLVLGALVLLAGPAFVHDGRSLSGVAPWMVVVVLGRDLLVTSIRGLYEARGVDFSAGFAGKLKMIVQSVAIPVILLALALHQPMGSASVVTARVAAWSVVLVTAWSAAPYVRRAIRAERGLRA
ncbi:MAG: CDP-diacylglycerol--glycerol-3-phosphate 3-phosphatidyltransferase [Phycisphaerae bacterium]|nr:CDP-diacylglycerol--glycerol-3-phosphate 3-phosphatidyltransferase [Phycisphaerae bacterium]